MNEIISLTKALSNERSIEDIDEIFLGENISDQQAKILSQNWLIYEKGLRRFTKGINTLYKNGEQPVVSRYIADASMFIHDYTARKLNAYALSKPLGKYLRGISICPVITSCLISNIKLTDDSGEMMSRNTTGLWKLCLDANDNNNAPRDATYKFMRDVANPKNKNNFYYNIFQERFVVEKERNENGFFKLEANMKLKDKEKEKYYRNHIDILSEGKLPDYMVFRKAATFSAKYLLGNFWETLYEYELNKPAPQGYIQDEGMKIFLKRPIVEGIEGIKYINVREGQVPGVNINNNVTNN